MKYIYVIAFILSGGQLFSFITSGKSVQLTWYEFNTFTNYILVSVVLVRRNMVISSFVVFTGFDLYNLMYMILVKMSSCL